VIPGGFRPDIDRIVRGSLEDEAVIRRVRELARDGVAATELIVAGGYELDPLRGRLRVPNGEVPLTERETEILALLLARPGRVVTASEIIERSWGAEADARYLQILRRHVSNIRQKLEQSGGGRALRTVRGIGYRFDSGASLRRSA